MWHWTRVLQLKELHMFLVEALKVAVPWCRKTMCGSASSAALGASLFWGTDLKCCCKKLKVPKIKYCQPSTCPVSVFDVLHCTCDLVDEALRSEQNTTASPFAVLCCSLFSELDPPSIICLSPPIFPPFFPPSQNTVCLLLSLSHRKWLFPWGELVNCFRSRSVSGLQCCGPEHQPRLWLCRWMFRRDVDSIFF